MNEYTTPLIITCNITGRKQKLYHRPYIDSLIAKHGSLENLLKNYVTKGAKRKSTNVESNQAPIVVAAKTVSSDTINITPRVFTVGKTIDGEIQTCSVYENYNS